MSKLKLYITRKVPASIIEPYEEFFDIRMWVKAEQPVPRDVLLKEAKDADGLLCLITEKLDAEFLSQVSHLKIIANMAVGYDNIDVQAARENGIIITNTPDVLTETTADLTFTLLMATARRVMESSQVITNNEWGDWSPFFLAGTDIHQQTIGIVGMGRIGEAVAKRAKGFNMKVLYHNRNRKPEVEKSLGVSYRSFDQLVTASDFVVSLVPYSPETENIFNKEVFKKMKDSAIFINVSRGGVVDEEALYEALKHRDISAAGLDVFKGEPIKGNHPLATLPNATLLPHIGSATTKTRKKMLTLCMENIKSVFHGLEPITPVQ